MSVHFSCFGAAMPQAIIVYTLNPFLYLFQPLKRSAKESPSDQTKEGNDGSKKPHHNYMVR